MGDAVRSSGDLQHGAPSLIDVSSLPRLSFDHVITETSVADTAFRISTVGPPWLSDDARSFVDGQPFSCEPVDACEQLDPRVAKGSAARFDLVMRHGHKPGEVLLVRVEDPS